MRQIFKINIYFFAKLQLIYLVLLIISCSYQLQVNTDKSYKKYYLDSLNEQLYLQGKIVIKNKGRQFSGTAELVFDEKFSYLVFKDSFFNPVLFFYMDKNKIKVKQKQKVQQFINNAETKKKYLNLNLTIAELQSIFWGRQTKQTKDLKFLFADKIPITVLKQKDNSIIKVDYLKWQNYTKIALPTQIVITSKESDIEIKFFIREHYINPKNFKLPKFFNDESS